MTLEQLEAQRHQALCHLNVTRQARRMVMADIHRANETSELVSPDTLDLADHMSCYESAAVRIYSNACKAVDDHRARLAAWEKDAEIYGDALNSAGWVFIEQCPEKSTLLFNNCKEPLRAAILKYHELVSQRGV